MWMKARVGGALCVLAVIGLPAIVGICPSGCVLPGGPFARSASEDYTATASAEGIQKIRIDWEGGTLDIRIDDAADEIRAEGRKTVRASTIERAEAGLEDFSIQWMSSATASSTVVLAFDRPASSFGLVFSATADITIPAGVELDINGENVSVLVVGNDHTTDVDVENGNVEVVEQSGETAVAIENGSATVESTGGDVDVNVEHGAIRIDAVPGDTARILADVAFGGIDIRVPADTAAELDLDTDLGSVETDLDGFTVTDLQVNSTSVTAILNGGGATIRARSNVGGIEFGPLPQS